MPENERKISTNQGESQSMETNTDNIIEQFLYSLPEDLRSKSEDEILNYLEEEGKTEPPHVEMSPVTPSSFMLGTNDQLSIMTTDCVMIKSFSFMAQGTGYMDCHFCLSTGDLHVLGKKKSRQFLFKICFDSDFSSKQPRIEVRDYKLRGFGGQCSRSLVFVNFDGDDPIYTNDLIYIADVWGLKLYLRAKVHRPYPNAHFREMMFSFYVKFDEKKGNRPKDD